MQAHFSIAVLMLAACGQALGDQASDERELTQLIKDLNEAVVKADVAFLERVLHEDYVHIRPRGTALAFGVSRDRSRQTRERR